MLNQLVADILADFTDEEGDPLAPEAYVRRQIERALPVVSTDLAVEYMLDGDDVSPDMPGDHREVWAIRGKIMVCRYLRAQAASRITFSSGDKKMDRSREAANWAALEKDLKAEYASRVKRINPEADETLITLEAHPRVYERGSAVD